MESLVLISSDLKLASPNFFLWYLPQVRMMLLSVLLLTLVWEAYSDQPSVKRFLGVKQKPLMSS